MLSAFDPTLLGIQYAVCRKGIMRDSSYPGKGENACGAPPQTALVTRGRGVRKPIDRLLWPLALGAWTYATGSPTPKGLGSIPCARKRPYVYRGFDTPERCVPVPVPSSGIDPRMATVRSFQPVPQLPLRFVSRDYPPFVGRSNAPRLSPAAPRLPPPTTTGPVPAP
jgi:hypothetical protein